MARELVWLENNSFAAWGCSECSWIVNPETKRSKKPSTSVEDAFKKHDCAASPRYQRKMPGTSKGLIR
jgi:hypothetical protein